MVNNNNINKAWEGKMNKENKETLETLLSAVKYFGVAETMKYAIENNLMTEEIRNALATK
jgi:hypothetical protein